VRTRVTDSTLPPTIGGLQRAIAEGALDPASALRMQRERLGVAAKMYRCVVAAHPIDRTLPTTGPLAGVGLAHKDVFAIAGRAPTCGAGTAPGRLPRRTARVLRRLRHAGAGNLAALAMAEFACGATGENRNAAEPANPIDPDAVVGGSSSGSAAAVAAGLCYASLGGDTAGSVRIPAATVGAVGLKPTFGRLPTEGVFPLAASLDCVGVLARCAADVAAIWRVVAAPPAGIAHSDDDGRPRKRWRIAAAIDDRALAPEVGAALDAFVTRLGHDAAVRRRAIPNLDALTHASEAVLHFEAARLHRRTLRNDPRERAPAFASIVLPGLAIPPAWYLRAAAERPARTHAFCRSALAAADVLLVPALAHGIPDWRAVHTASPRFDARELHALYRYMPFVNYLGLPAIVFPIGVDARGRPVCVQAIARPFAEHTLLAFVEYVERELHRRVTR
jgi:aspartyl-tRNA(Asn)/glutamyl-tRNA(Gln) amidotransferase subunit A